MSTLSDISIFVSRDWSPSLRNSCADVTVKRTGLPVECFCVSEYLSYVRHSNAILYVWHTPMCVCVDVNSWVGNPCVSNSITEAQIDDKYELLCRLWLPLVGAEEGGAVDPYRP